MAARLAPTLGLCTLFLLCSHEGVREWVAAFPGLWMVLGPILDLARILSLETPLCFLAMRVLCS